MSEALKCAHCGEVWSEEGFVEVARFTGIARGNQEEIVLRGVRLRVGDVLRIECARDLGFDFPPDPHPRLQFRVTA
jgi:hypothetical protein